MRNTTRAVLLAALFLAGPLAAQPRHDHTGLSDGRELHQGDRVWFRGQHAVSADEVIEGDVVVASGSLVVRGEVHGDAVVGGGDLVVERGALIYGDAVVTGGKLVNRGGSVLGKIQEGSPQAKTTGAMHIRRGWLGSLQSGFSGILQTIALGILLAGVGVALTFYGRPHLNRAVDVLRRTPGNAVGIGAAANVLAIPAFLAGLVLLTVTIIGIPLLLLFIPLFWAMLAALGGLGLIVVAQVVGRRTAEQAGEFASLQNEPFMPLFTGLAVLLAPRLAAHLLELTPFLNVMADLVGLLASMLLWAAASVGAGAVLIVAVSLWNERGYRGDGRAMGMDDLGTSGAHVA